MGKLKVSNLDIYYSGGVMTVSDFSLCLENGELKALVGAIGAGKSSVLRAIAGLVKYQGKIEFDGEDLASVQTKNRNFVYASFDSPLFESKSVEYNLCYGARLRKLENSQIVERMGEVCEAFNLTSLTSCKIKSLSRAQKRMVVLARAFMRDAALYLINEPCLGLGEDEAIDIMQRIHHFYKKRNLTMLIATSDFQSVYSFGCDIIMFNNGKKICEGKPDFYKNSPPNLFTALFTASSAYYVLKASLEKQDENTNLKICADAKRQNQERIARLNDYKNIADTLLYKDIQNTLPAEEILIGVADGDVIWHKNPSSLTEMEGFSDIYNYRKAILFTPLTVIKRFFIFNQMDKKLLCVLDRKNK